MEKAGCSQVPWWLEITRRPEARACAACLLGTVVGALAGGQGYETLAVGGYGAAFVAGGWYAGKAAWRALWSAKIEVDLLMVLAALGAAGVGAPLEGAVLLFLFSLSNVLQQFSVDRSRSAVRALMDLRPRMAMVRRGGDLVETPVESLEPGEIIVVRPGERMPADGVVREGLATVDQSAMTGESVPVERGPGQRVLGGTVVMSGAVDVEVTDGADHSLLARMVRLVEAAQETKAGSQRFLEAFEQRYAAGVIGFVVLLCVVPLVFGAPVDSAIYRAMTVLVVMSPCALVISIPATILSAIAGAARQGVLIKGGVHLERMALVDTVAFDKTGTLTEGKLSVHMVVPWHGLREEELLRLAAGVGRRSGHPIARAIVREAEKRQVEMPEATDFRSFIGLGTEAVIDGRRITVGNIRSLVADGGCGDIVAHGGEIEAMAAVGCTPVGVAVRRGDGTVGVLGLIGVADTLRPDAAETIMALRRAGVRRIVMITGDDRRVAAAVACGLGLDEIHAELLPADKVRVVNALQKNGQVAMVGDGVNDAPSLAAANVGIAMGAGSSDIALESADVVVVGDRLRQVEQVIRLARKSRRVVLQNLTFASVVIALLTMAALAGDVPLTLGVLGHEGSTVLVCLNGLRLLLGVPREA